MENQSAPKSPFRGLDYLKITILGFALGGLANAMHSIILPLRIQDFVEDSRKSTFLGLITFAGLLIAMLVQPIAGSVSDRSTSRWGRRRPFIFIGITAAIILLAGIGSVGSFAALFIIWGFTQTSLNIAQGPFQAFIPDLVPSKKRGLASGVKNLLEIAGGVVLIRVVSIFMSNYSGNSSGIGLWSSLGVLGLVLLVTLVITLVTVREKPGNGLTAASGAAASFPDIFHINIKAHPGFLLFLVSRLLFIMALTTLQTFALYYFQDVVGIADPAKITADLITAVGIAMLIIVIPAGRISDKIGRKSILIACGFLAAAGIAVIFYFPVYHLILFAGSLIGLAAGAFLSTNWALATDLIPQEEAGRYMGITNLASAGGGALARLIGPVIDFFNGLGTGTGYSVMLGSCFAYFIIGSILIWRIQTTRHSGTTAGLITD